jgi:hypothetical protein|tara:strand:+ start:103 stop:600 length:498 start_codon:yes stop_codon:yes gene_type:complete
MATVALANSTRGSSARGRQPYFLQNSVNMATAATSKGTALASSDVITAITVPANTVILHAGWEVTTAHAGTSSDTAFDFGVTGGNVDVFVDGFDFDGASVGDYSSPTADNFNTVVVGGTADTIDILLQAMTGTTTAGVLRCYAILMDCDDVGTLGPDEVDRDTLA